MPNLSAAIEHLLDHKTKPPGSLGALEALALRLGVIQHSLSPVAAPAELILFAADHGVYAQGVAPYPQEVTAQMVTNILKGGAASSVLARQHGIGLTVVDVGVKTELAEHANLRFAKVRAGSRDLAIEPAMTPQELQAALAAGRDAVRSRPVPVTLFGEMGIANTTPASAIACALLGAPGHELAGPGTGLNAAGIAHKAQVIDRALALHQNREPLEVLRCLGGLEIAALCGAFMQAAEQRQVIVVDGFIACAALMIAVRLQASVLDCCVFAHASGETGHTRMLDALAAQPLLRLGMRLGEGTGALVAYPLLVSACALLREMASFESAGVSAK
jgi:nicotinate-nucleotide--dimethylbenzimidazole phosphoribosyltransferase